MEHDFKDTDLSKARVEALANLVYQKSTEYYKQRWRIITVFVSLLILVLGFYGIVLNFRLDDRGEEIDKLSHTIDSLNTAYEEKVVKLQGDHEDKMGVLQEEVGALIKELGDLIEQARGDMKSLEDLQIGVVAAIQAPVLESAATAKASAMQADSAIREARNSIVTMNELIENFGAIQNEITGRLETFDQRLQCRTLIVGDAEENEARTRFTPFGVELRINNIHKNTLVPEVTLHREGTSEPFKRFENLAPNQPVYFEVDSLRYILRVLYIADIPGSGWDFAEIEICPVY